MNSRNTHQHTLGSNHGTGFQPVVSAERSQALPPLDQGVSALLDDLSSSGLLETTLVVMVGEFGRTPKIGGNVGTPSYVPDGRDHWGGVFFVLLAGAGVRGGHPTMPSMVYSPSHLGDWEITAGTLHVSQYQFVIHDGNLPETTTNRLWLNFAEPLVPSVIPGSRP